MLKREKFGSKSDTGANLGFKAKLWQMTDGNRNNMDAPEYKHVVLGLFFLKYISDAFEAKHAELKAQKIQGADLEDPDKYRAASIFWVPKEARWSHLMANAPQLTISTIVDDAMTAIERDNPSLEGALPKDYAQRGLDKHCLDQLINLVSDIALGAPVDCAKDTLGRVCEYFLSRGLHGGAAWPALQLDADSPLPLVPREKQSRRCQTRPPRPPETNPLHRRPLLFSC